MTTRPALGMKGHPVFVPFGFRDAASVTCSKQLAYPLEKGKWYHTKTSDIEDALKGILTIIMNRDHQRAERARRSACHRAQAPPSRIRGSPRRRQRRPIIVIGGAEETGFVLRHW